MRAVGNTEEMRRSARSFLARGTASKRMGGSRPSGDRDLKRETFVRRNERDQTRIELLRGRKDHAELVAAAILFLAFSEGLRVDHKEHEVEGAADPLRRVCTHVGKPFGDVAHKNPMKIVLEMRVLHLVADGQRIPDAALGGDLEKLVHLYVMRLRLEFEHVMDCLVLRHGVLLMENGGVGSLRIFRDLALRYAVA